jgi:hypothetical protein
MSFQGTGWIIELEDGWSDDGWTRVPRNIIRDQSLSWKAKGLVAFLASHTDGFRITAEFIINAATDGRDSVRAGLRELRDAGYLAINQTRDATGRMGAARYILSRFPRSQPMTENPPTVEAAAANRPQRETTYKEDQEEPAPLRVARDTDQLDLVLSQKPSVEGDQQPARTRDTRTDAKSQWANSVDTVDQFGTFWAAYPRRVGKLAARRQWDKAAKAGVAPDVIVAAAARYANECEGREAQFIKHPSTWLSNGCWDDEPAPAAKPTAGTGVYRDRDMWTPEVIADMKRKYPGAFGTPNQGGVTVR